jgi:septum formation protein
VLYSAGNSQRVTMTISVQNRRLYLASQSPRRAELLQQISVEFSCISSSVDETPMSNEVPEVYVSRLAIAKARAGWQQMKRDRLPPLPILAADTTVVLGGQILGKPTDRNHGVSMLTSLSGATHKVMTGVCLYYGSDDVGVIDKGSVQSDEIVLAKVNMTEVTFRPLTVSEIEAYWHTGEPLGKAGAYAIQGLAAIYIDRIEGSYSSVVGLPLSTSYQLLEQIEKKIREKQL